jgi:hypothetical protein
VINDNLEVDAEVFISNNQSGEKSKTVERQRDREREKERDRESVCVCVCERERERDLLLKVKDSVNHKMYSWRAHLLMDMCD